MTRHKLYVYSAVLFATLVTAAAAAHACPFCSAQSQTFSEEMRSMDAVAIARLVKLPASSKNSGSTLQPPNGATRTESDFEIGKATFEIVEVLKGNSVVGDQREIETLYFGDGKIGQEFLVMGVDPPKLMWSTPMRLTDRGRTYLTKLTTIPEKGVERMRFFQDYLEDSDEMLARDAYDEFANTPYEDVKKLRPYMKHDELVKWIKSEDVPASRRRLYLTMLGVCGGTPDLPMLEDMMRSSDRRMKAGLDAMIACYLTLAGEQGMPLIEELFLKNQNAEYADTYAAIMALRFHGTETDVIAKARIVEGLRHMLDRPKLADLVIPDLARWKDWSVMPKLVELFKNADEKSSWVRVPVINYLRACPLPEAKAYISELEKVDPAAVKRANTFFPFSPAGTSSSGWQRRQEDGESVNAMIVSEDESFPSPSVRPGDDIAAAKSTILARSGQQAPLADTSGLSAGNLHPLLMIGTPLIFAAALFLVMWSILRGAGDAGRTSV